MEQLGKYQLVRKLATGGMAEVFLAKAAGPMGFQKTLVVKRILPHYAEDPEFIEMFLAEARIAAELNHPNIVQIFDFGQEGETWYLAMEFIDGPNLRVLQKRANKAGVEIPYALAAKIISLACEGLTFAHDYCNPETGKPLNLIHRDVSPDNILLSKNGGVKVVDFGVAKVSTKRSVTRSGVVKGKLAYMPPEQLANEALDRRADVYSLGIVLFELLSGGALPFNDQSEPLIVQALMSREPLWSIARLRPDVPPMLERIVAKTVEKDPSLRYANCKALQADLERFIVSVGEPVQSHELADLVRQVEGPTVTDPGLAAATPNPRTVPEERATPEPFRPRPLPRPMPPRASSSGTPVLRSPTPTSQPFASFPVSIPLEQEEPEDDPMAATQRTPKGKRKAGRRSGPPRESRVGRAVLIGALSGAMVLVVGAFLSKLGERVPRREASAPPAPPRSPHVEVSPPAPGPEDSAPATDAPTEAEAEPGAKTPDGEAPAESVSPTESVSPAEPVKSASTPRTASPAHGPVRLEIRVRPYAQVYLDGNLIGETPFQPVEAAAGKHILRLVNAKLHKDFSVEVTVKANEENLFKYNLKED